MLQAVAVPGSLSEAHAALAGQAKARIIAGGTAVMPEATLGTDAFDRLVSLRRAGLSGLRVDGGTVTLGAAATLADLEAEPALGFLRPALDTIASPTIRNMATVGGNLFVKAPYGDLAACLIALGATATVSGGAATRAVPVETLVAEGIGPQEIVTEVSFDLPADGAFRFVKAGRKALNAAAIVTVAAVVTVAGGKVATCRIALGGVGTCPLRATSVELALTGGPLDRANAQVAAARAADDIAPFDDAHASAWYRARVAPVHVRRALIGE
jgi:CO/xanthine dehydrogenase FAD-binding subunit